MRQLGQKMAEETVILSFKCFELGGVKIRLFHLKNKLQLFIKWTLPKSEDQGKGREGKGTA